MTHPRTPIVSLLALGLLATGLAACSDGPDLDVVLIDPVCPRTPEPYLEGSEPPPFSAAPDDAVVDHYIHCAWLREDTATYPPDGPIKGRFEAGHLTSPATPELTSALATVPADRSGQACQEYAESPIVLLAVTDDGRAWRAWIPTDDCDHYPDEVKAAIEAADWTLQESWWIEY